MQDYDTGDLSGWVAHASDWTFSSFALKAADFNPSVAPNFATEPGDDSWAC